MSNIQVGDKVRIKPGEHATGLSELHDNPFGGLTGLPQRSFFWPTIPDGGLVGVVVDYKEVENIANHWGTVTVERDGKLYIVNHTQVEKLENL